MGDGKGTNKGICINLEGKGIHSTFIGLVSKYRITVLVDTGNGENIQGGEGGMTLMISWRRG